MTRMRDFNGTRDRPRDLSAGGDPVVLTDIQELSSEEFHHLSIERGLPEKALRSFLKLLALRLVPPEQLDRTLRGMAEQHGKFKQKVAGLKLTDPATQSLIDRVRVAADQAAWFQAEALMNAAAGLNLQAAESVPANARMTLLLEAASMKDAIGDLTRSLLRYSAAVQYYREAVKLAPAGNDLLLARYLVSLGYGLILCGDNAAAEKPLTRASAIRRRELGPDSEGVRECLGYLGLLYHNQGRYAEAESFYRQSLAVTENVSGPQHPDVATTLNNLASIYYHQGYYGKARQFYRRSLAISEELLGPRHPDVAATLHNLASVHYLQGEYAHAEALYRRSLAVTEDSLGPRHPDVAATLNNLAVLYYYQGEYAHAEALYRRSLEIAERVLGPQHPDVAAMLNNWAVLHRHEGRFAEAERLCRRSLAISEKVLGAPHPDVAHKIKNLASICEALGREDEAMALRERISHTL